ncbi:MAG: hypothetical protein C5B59_06005 [Bacteroidetes bacterium]|nr:MAG: hypothetical protein C5B59_06005 [Bacteroidota bacterium]
MADESAHSLTDFSFIQNGIFYSWLQRLNLAGPSTRSYLLRILAICGIVWLPLLILTLLQGLTFGRQVEIPFAHDFVTHARLLVIIPILVFSERSVDYRLKELSRFFFTAGILNKDDYSKFAKIKQAIVRYSLSWWADLVILILIASNIVIRWKSQPHVSSFWVLRPENGTEVISWAGIWYLYISIPLFQYLLLRWLWRWILWLIYFRKIAHLPLKLNPSHPDKAGGLGFLGIQPAPFLSVTLAMSMLVSVAIAGQIFFFKVPLREYYVLLAGVAFLAIILNVLPLLMFMPTMAKHRRKGIFEYSALIQEHHREFDQKWLNKKTDEQILGTSDPSSMIDINSSFESVINMRFFPFDIRIMFTTILIVILPILPLMFFEYNLMDVIKEIMKLLL